MAAEKDLKEIIKEAAAEPQSASIDGQTIQQRPLSDLIARREIRGRSRSIPATRRRNPHSQAEGEQRGMSTPAGTLLSWTGRPLVVPEKRVSARYDAAQTTTENAAHWSMATGWSADAEANAEVRRILRNRARYETANNPWVNGMLVTQAYDVIGTGPRLQMTSENQKLNRLIEYDFSRWCHEIGLAELLQTAQMTKCRDGESFLMLSYNPRLRNAVKLDVLQIEADRVSNILDGARLDESNIDGIQFDGWGNPVWYNVLKYHPGGALAGMPERLRACSGGIHDSYVPAGSSRPASGSSGNHPGAAAVRAAAALYAGDGQKDGDQREYFRRDRIGELER